MQFVVINFAGSRREIAAKKNESKGADESSSDYEEVEENKQAKSKAATLPANLPPSMNVAYSTIKYTVGLQGKIIPNRSCCC